MGGLFQISKYAISLIETTSTRRHTEEEDESALKMVPAVGVSDLFLQVGGLGRWVQKKKNW